MQVGAVSFIQFFCSALHVTPHFHSLVPEHRLPKFAGRALCESHNLGGDDKGALLALGSPRIGVRQLVSKNVTHALAWDGTFHASMAPHCIERAGIAVAYDAMSRYLEEGPKGKLLHEPLAAVAVVAPELFTWKEVEVIHGDLNLPGWPVDVGGGFEFRAPRVKRTSRGSPTSRVERPRGVPNFQ